MQIQSLLLAIAFVTAVISSADAQTLQSGPITFRFATDNANGVPNSWIVADGEITSETPKAFRQFLASNNFKRDFSRQAGGEGGVEIYLNSLGGNLFGGIELGEIIREFNLGTRVASSIDEGDRFHSEYDGPGVCYSACAFAFLGGIWRTAQDHTIGVHQHFIETALADPTAKKFTAADYSDVQMVEGLLADYVLRMGVDARFLVRASTTTPDKLYTFTFEEMRQFGITWNELDYTDWRLEAFQGGLIAQSRTRNGKNLATLFCRKDRAVRLLINSSIDQGDEEYVQTLLNSALLNGVDAELFGAHIPAQSISSHIEHGRLMLEIQIPPSLSTTSPVSESMFCCFKRLPVFRLIRLKLTFSLSDDAG
jgi:hypothetical protein